MWNTKEYRIRCEIYKSTNMSPAQPTHHLVKAQFICHILPSPPFLLWSLFSSTITIVIHPWLAKLRHTASAATMKNWAGLRIIKTCLNIGLVFNFLLLTSEADMSSLIFWEWAAWDIQIILHKYMRIQDRHRSSFIACTRTCIHELPNYQLNSAF